MNENKKIMKLNDLLRETLAGGRVLLTHGILELGEEMVTRVLERVQNYDDFTEENDPHSEHDFGSFWYKGLKFLWKIDYYDEQYQMHSEDASDPSKTRRVLTVMLAHEY